MDRHSCEDITCYRAAFWLPRFEVFTAVWLKVPFFSAVTLLQSVIRCRRFQASYFIHLQWSIGHYARPYCLSKRRLIRCLERSVPITHWGCTISQKNGTPFWVSSHKSPKWHKKHFNVERDFNYDMTVCIVQCTVPGRWNVQTVV